MRGARGEPAGVGGQTFRPVMTVSRATVLRLLTHVGVWAPFLAVVVSSLFAEFHVVGDGSVIALRSWQELTRNGPLLGQPTLLGHHLYDPGPLEYWLLVLPVHLDPVRGVLFGAALWCMVAASVTVEAARSVLSRAGGLIAVAGILLLLLWEPGVAVEPYWNPYFGMMFFFAAIASAWAVASGHRWWWPALVITASVAAQAHLMFVLGAAALALAALAVGMIDAFRAKSGYRWAVAGLLAGLACWSAPLVQQFTQSPGNLSALLARHSQEGYSGLAFALKALMAAVQQPVLWWRPDFSSSVTLLHMIQSQSVAAGVALLVLTVAEVFLAAFGLRCRSLTALAGISLLADAAGLVTLSRIPVDAVDTRLSYLFIVMIPVGMLALLTFVATLVLMFGAVPWLRTRSATDPPAEGGAAEGGAAEGGVRRWAAPLGSAAVVGLAVAVLVPDVTGQRPAMFANDVVLGDTAGTSAAMIERALPKGEIGLTLRVIKPLAYRLTNGIVWALTADGYRPVLVPDTVSDDHLTMAIVMLGTQDISLWVTRPGERTQFIADARAYPPVHRLAAGHAGAVGGAPGWRHCARLSGLGV
ncbi:MAG TPA: hypothetical protein VGS19_13900 [Streptosporangiaceae bacterium]|nr:hypothetical protein [Streptosporangiaceae bacterium]